MRQPLTREQVIRAIERNGEGEIPLFLHKFWGQGLLEKYGQDLLDIEKSYPDDICECYYMEPGYDVSPNQNEEYRFGFSDYTNSERHSIGEAVVLLEDWKDFQEFLDHFPNPREEGNFDYVKERAKEANGRYKLGCWWRVFHERFWSIRGMENLMLDYYDHMDELKILGNRLVEFYKVIIDQFAEAGMDGIFTSDDLGHQSGPMMSPAVFRELYFPLYKELIDYTHKKGMHFFLHSCGDNTLLMEDLIEAGLDVFHPVQAGGCMDYEEVAAKFGGRITFLIGIDVQKMLPNATKEEVEAELRNIKSLFLGKGKGLLMGMGNGIMPDTPLENIKTALDVMTEPVSL